MVTAVVLSFVIIMVIAMYVEAARRSRQVDSRVVAAPPSRRSVNPTVYVPPPKPPQAIPPALRAELDQTPEWWVGRYHELLEMIDAPVVLGETWEMHSANGDVVVAYDERGYPDCTCHRCRRICE